MLAHPTKSITEVLDRFENVKFTCEFKYDGERAQVSIGYPTKSAILIDFKQIHRLENGDINIFSRNSENLSVKYPDIVALMPQVRGNDKK